MSEIAETVSSVSPRSVGPALVTTIPDAAQIRAWFRGPVPPAKLSPLYRAGLVVTAFAMILLPTVYLAIIAGVGWGVWWWMTTAVGLLGSGLMGVIAYGAPIFAGGTVVFFLFKPLLARPPKAPPPVALDLGREPVLAAFIAQLCAAVGAPRPAVIHVDSQVNASASFRRGWRSVPRRELALTIGLPLVAGLDARQLAGVLAHEFGHFAQGAGMSATFVIRTVNSWFSRVVFERDEWDAKLEAMSQQGDFRVMIVVWIARGAVWLARKILHGLMLAGHAISCFQLRQMEFDADHYEIQLAGTASHLATSRELRLLNAAFGQAITDLRTLWQDGRLADDLPAFVRIRRLGLTAEEIAAAEQQAGAQPTKWFHTHPSDAARTAAAEAAASAGVFALDAPATALFADFAATCRTATLAYYQAQLGSAVKADSLVPTAALVAQANIEREARAAFDALVGPVLSLDRPLTFGPALLCRAGNSAELATTRALAEAELQRLREPVQQRQKEWEQVETDTFNAWAAGRLLTNGIKITPGTFGLAESSPAAAARRETECRERSTKLVAEFQPATDRLGEWLAASIALARQLPPENPDAAELLRLAPLFTALEPVSARFLPLAQEVRLFSVLVANAQTLAGNPSFAMLVTGTRTRLRERLDAFLAAAEAVAYPFPSVGSATLPTLAAHLRQSLVPSSTAIEAQAYHAINEFAPLNFRVLGRLVLHGRRLPAHV
jgi:Zn-dependent protease with chaperone function